MNRSPLAQHRRRRYQAVNIAVRLCVVSTIVSAVFSAECCLAFAEEPLPPAEATPPPTTSDDVLTANPIKLTISKDAPSSNLPVTTGPLSLDDAVQLALKGNLALKQAEKAWTITKFLARSALAKFGPSASFTTFFSESSLNQMLFFPNDSPVAAPTMQPIVRGTSLSLVFAGWQPLFTGGRLLGGYRAARAVERQSLEQYRANKIQTALKVKEAYWEAAWQEAKLRVDTDYARYRENSAANMQARVREGKAPRADYLREVAEVSKARQQVNSDYEDFNIALVRLKVALGANLSSLISLKDNLEFVETPQDFSFFLAKAANGRPEIAQAAGKVAELRARRMVAMSKYSPQVGLYGLGSNITGSSPDGNGNGRWGGLVGIVGSVTLFDSGSRFNELRAASTAVQQAEIAEDETQLRVAESVSEAWIHLDLARKNVDLAKAEVTSAEEDHRLIHTRYLVGKAIALEDFDASVKLRQARLSLLESIFKYRLAHAELIASSGDM